MEEYTDQQVKFQIVNGVNPKKYGFIQIRDYLIFHLYKECNDNWKKFVINNFDSFSKCYYAAMQFDATKDRARKRKLSTFLKSIFDQENFDVALVMVKAISYLLSKNIDEDLLVEKVIKEILPNCCFIKKVNHSNKYVWTIDEEKKFKSGIGKIFVLNYINNNFDKDTTWKFIKKYCFYKDGVWVYKNDKTKEIIQNAINHYIKSGGIIVEEKTVNQKFEAFIPLKLLSKDAQGSSRFVLDKDAATVGTAGGTEKRKFLTGAAATTGIDREGERLSKNFIKKMKETAVDLPLFCSTHNPQDVDRTIGVITKSAGDDNTFEIEAKLVKEETNANVSKILGQMNDGVKYGFSVGGRITKAFREFNEGLKKEVLVLDDGELFHVLLTNQPANPETFAEAIAKSLDSSTDKKDTDKMYEFKHNSRLHKDEPDVDNLEKSNLPETAFPINHKTHECFKDYAHHFISGVELFLHKGLLIQSYGKAVKEKAPECVLNHLVTHLQIVGLSKQMNELATLSNTLDSIDDMTKMMESLTTELTPFFKNVNSVSKLNVGIDEKKKILKNVIEDVSAKITNILSTIDVEE